jgi:uncharacterized protein (TIGR01244 family)
MRLLVLALCLAAGACAAPGPVAVVPAAPAPVTALPSASAGELRIGRVILAGQPNADDFRRWQALGARHVLNVRTPDEMATVREAGLDEPALLAALGMSYVHVPLGGKAFPMRPEPVDALRDLLARDDALVVLHCASASRAGQVWAGHQVRDAGRDPTEVFRQLEPVGLWPLPLQMLTGIDIELDAKRTK